MGRRNLEALSGVEINLQKGKARQCARKVKMKKATSKDWKNKPLPKKRSLIPADRQFTPAEMNRIRQGLIPMEMEEKWFIFFKRNRLYFHRSWTAVCVYVAHFKRRRDGYILHLIEANRNARQYSEKDDAYDAKMFFYILDLLLLGRETPFPSKEGESPDVVPIKQWSQVGKAMLSESKSESKGPAGFMAALDQASKENYLGDPKVVSKLLSDFSAEALRRRASGMDDEEANICDDSQAAAIADIFLGKSPDYAPMIPWNSPGQIDRWLADELKHLKVADKTPELTVANVMHWILKDMFSFTGLTEEDRNWNIDATLGNFTNVMLGISIRDDDVDVTDTPSVSKP